MPDTVEPGKDPGNEMSKWERVVRAVNRVLNPAAE